MSGSQDDYTDDQQEALPQNVAYDPRVWNDTTMRPGMVPPQPASNTRDQINARLAARGRPKAAAAAWEPADDASPLAFPAPPGPKPGAIKDFARETWISTLGMGQGAVGMAKFAADQLMGDSETSAWVKKQQDALGGYIDEQTSKLSPEAQQAMRSSIFGGQDEQGALPGPMDVGVGRYLGATIASLVPQAVTAVVPGKIVGTVVGKLLVGAIGSGSKAAAGATMAARLGTTGGLFGIIDAGDAYNELSHAVEHATPAEMKESPVYQHLVETGMSDEDARKQLIKQIAPTMVAGRFAAGAVAGAGLGEVMGGAGGVVKGAAEGAIAMGGQAGADDALMQKAKQDAGLQGSYDPSATATAFAKGAISGGVLGAAGGLLHRGAKRVADPKVVGVPGDAAAALKEVLPAPEPQQAEMFQQHEMDPNAPQPAGPPVPPPTAPGMPAGEDQGNLFTPQTPPPRPTQPEGPATYPRGEFQPGVPAEAPQQVANLELPPGREGAEPQGELFPEQQPAPAPEQPIAAVAPKAASEPAAKPLSRADAIKTLVDAGMPKKGLAAMKLADLHERVASLQDKNTSPAEGSAASPDATVIRQGEAAGAIPATTPEPAGDIAAQMAALRDKTNPKDAVFVAKGSPLPTGATPGVIRVGRPEGTLFTTNADKAQLFKAKSLTDDHMAAILGLPETKTSALASGDPQVVQAKNAVGGVVTEAVVSPHNVERATAELASHAPGGTVETTTPEQAQARRAAPSPAAEPSPPPAKPLTVADKLRAKRVAEKARMSAGSNTEQAKAYVAPEGEAAPVERERAGRTHAETMGDMRDAFQVAARGEVVPLKAGDLGRVMERAMAEIAGHISRQDQTEGGIHEAIATWGRENANPIPGTRTRRAVVADKMLKLMTGKGLGARDEFVREARSESAGQQSVMEKEGTAREEVEHESGAEAARHEVQGGEGAGEARVTQDYGAVEAKPVNVKAASKTRVLEDLHRQVVEGKISPQVAESMYGPEKAKGKGRTFKSYGDYLDKQIADGENPATEAEFIRQAKALDENRAMAPQAKKAAGDKINALLRSIDPEQIQKLKDLRESLHDPVGAEINRLLPRQSGGDVRDEGIAREASRYVQMAADPRVNSAVSRGLDRAETEGSRYSTHDMLRDIVNSSNVRAELRPMRELAARLLKIAPDLDVMTPETAGLRGAVRPEDINPLQHGYLGATMRNDQGVPTHVLMQHEMPGEASQHVEVGLHEVLHSVTASYLSAAERQNHPDAQALRAMMDEVRRQAPTQETMRAQGLDPTVVGHALKDVHEMHAMLMSNPSFQSALTRMRAGPEFLDKMKSLGFPTHGEGRSVWKSFTDWVRKAVGLNPATSGSDYTLMDHLLRPGQDITDRAAKFNRDVRDPVVRQMGTTMLRETGGRLTNLTDAAARHIDPGGLNDRLRKGWLQVAPTDAIHWWNHALFEPTDRLGLAFKNNPLTDYRRAQELIAHGAKAFHNAYSDASAELVQKLRGKGGAQVGQLMNDATLARVHLGDPSPEANAHLKTPEEKTALAELQNRYASLPAEARQTYNDVRDMYAKWYRVERDASLKAMTERALPDATPEQTKAITRMLQTKASIESFLKQDSDIAREFGAQWDAKRAIVRGVARVHDMGFVQGDYFPLRRHGDYVVSYGSHENGDLGVEMFERRGQAEARRAELEREDVDNLSQVQSKRENKLHEIAPTSSFIDELHASMKSRPELAAHADEARDLLQSVAMQHATRSQAAKSRMRRQGVQGASIDAARVLAQEYVAQGARMGHLEHGSARAQALAQMDLVTRQLGRLGDPGEQIRARAVLNEMQQRLATGDQANNVLQGISRRATGLGYVQSLMSFSHVFTGTVEAHMNSTSLLGARHGFMRSTGTLAKALADVSPVLMKKGAAATFKAMSAGLRASDWNLAHYARDKLVEKGANAGHMERLFSALDEAGLIDHTMETEMRRIAKAGGAGSRVGDAWQRFMDFNAIGAHSVDVANKSAVAKAAFDLEMRRGGNETQARDYAVDMVRKVAPNFNVGNKARITTSQGMLGGFAAPLTQFKQYGIHMYGVLANLTRDSLHGADQQTKNEARKALAGIIVTHAAMAGALSTIADPLRYVGGAYDFITGADRPHDYQNDARGALSDWFGPEIGELLARGLPHAIGIDIHRRVGLGNLLEVPDLESFDTKGMMKMMATALTGAAGQDAATMVGGLGKALRGDVMGGLEDAVPRVARDVMKAVRIADKGVVDTRGNTIVPAAKISPYNVAAQAVGFQPSVVSEAREGRQAIVEAKMEAQSDRNHLTQAWMKAAPDDRAAVMSQIREFNMSNPGSRITIDQLIRQKQAQAKAAQQPALFGLHVPAKQTRELAPAGRFAVQ